MEYLMSLPVLLTEITFKELLFCIIVVICIVQGILLGVISSDCHRTKRKYFSLIQNFQVSQVGSCHSDSRKASMIPAGGNKEKSEDKDSDKRNILYSTIYKNLQKLMKEEKIYHDPRLTRDEVVNRLGTSRKVFLESLQSYTDLSFTEYTNQYRLDEAVELLEKEEYTNETIAEEVGFGSVNTFYRQFRQKYGISPSEYRKALNGNLAVSGF